ncbi:hypothetical protein [uncultured Roseibium sp.]|uniref:hypothetical protein n=1 Tax=uncultured Roseibium sp. TaxID=1936171 RepID=UPI00262582AC|nr:hypothetical protein [uncultured Roseibium sp.]
MFSARLIEIAVKVLPYILAAALAVFVLFKIEENGTLKADLRSTRSELDATYKVAANKDRIIEADRQRAVDDFHAIREMENQIDGLEIYISTLEDRDRECLSSADTKRLLLIFPNE